MSGINLTAGRSRKILFGFFGTTVPSILILMFALAPFLWIALTSIKADTANFAEGVQYLPSKPTLENYRALWATTPFGRDFWNSLIIAVVVVVLSLLVSILAAYALSHFEFRLRTPLITSFLLIYMFPEILLLVPLFILMRTLGVLNTYAGLVMAEMTLAIPFCVWMLTSYFKQFPADLEEAAQIDGATQLGAFVRVVLPLAVPAIVAASLLAFIISWNNFLFAFMFTTGDDVRTLPVALQMFVGGEYRVFYGEMSASAVLTTLPVAGLFLFFQRYLVSGLTAGAVKA